MKKNKLIYALLLCISISIVAGCTNNHTTIKEKIDEENFVTVNLKKSGVKIYMDLSAKRWYGGICVGVVNNTVYNYRNTYQDKLLGFNYTKKTNLLYPFIADRTTVGKVKESNYVIVKNIKNNSEQKKLMDFLHHYGFKGYKVKIFYNHNCLPVKVQLIDRESNKWKTINTYSYPHISSKQYEKNWKKYVKEVKAGYYLD